jgi:hypothetical protein
MRLRQKEKSFEKVKDFGTETDEIERLFSRKIAPESLYSTILSKKSEEKRKLLSCLIYYQFSKLIYV